MAIRFDDSADYLSRTSNLLNYNSAYTVSFWLYLSSGSQYYPHAWAICASSVEAANDYNNSDFLGCSSDGVSFRVGAYVGGSGSDATGSALSVGTWYHVAVRRNSASSLEAFLNGVSNATCNQDITGRTSVAGEFMGRFNGTDYALNGRIAHYKSWARALSDAEIRAEMNSVDPVSLDSIRHVHDMFPGATEALFEKLRGESWTSHGSLTDEDGPAVPVSKIRYRKPPLVQAGGASVTGTGAASLPAQTSSGSGIASHPGTGSPSLKAPTTSGSGVASHPATGSIVLGAVTSSGTGRVAPRGNGAATLPAITASGAGVASHPGQATISLPAQTASGSGLAKHEATGTPSLPAITVSGSGVANRQGSGSPSLPAITVSGSGQATSPGQTSGSGAISLPAQTVSGTGHARPRGQGALGLPAQTASGSGVSSHQASGAVLLTVAAIAGTGRVAPRGQGVLVLAAIVAAGAGQLGHSGSGVLTMAAMTCAGTGSNGQDVAVIDQMQVFTKEVFGVQVQSGSVLKITPNSL